MPQYTKLTRRGFLQTAAIAAAAPLILPARAQGANERISLAVLGSGRRGTQVMGEFLRETDIEAVAVCDVQETWRDKAAQVVDNHYGHEPGNGGCAKYNDFREVLERDDVDAVLIAPQDHWHALMAVAAAEHGKDIYCEKPLGVSVRECQLIRDAVRKNNVIFQTGTQQRSGADFRHACEIARNGYLGNIHTVEVAAPGPSYQRTYAGDTAPQPVPPGFDYAMYVGPAQMNPYNEGRLGWPDWYLIWDYSVGFIVNWGVHHLDIALWGCPKLAEQPFDLTCSADYRDDGLCDNVNAWQAEYVYANGLRMSFTDTGHPHEQGCRFMGSKGWVHVNRQGIKAEPASLLDVAFGANDTRLHLSDNHQHDFVTSVQSREDPVAPVEAGLKASYFGMVADIAARLQRPVHWDPATEQFADDPEANGMLARPMRAPWVL
jgi:predicted dehydrogenase